MEDNTLLPASYSHSNAPTQVKPIDFLAWPVPRLRLVHSGVSSEHFEWGWVLVKFADCLEIVWKKSLVSGFGSGAPVGRGMVAVGFLGAKPRKL